MSHKHPFRFLWISLIIVFADQITKICVRHFMYDQSISVLGDFFLLTHVQNPGAAFSLSLGSDAFNRMFFTVVASVMIVLIFLMLRFSKNFWEKLSFSLIIGGAIGNVIDRVWLGSVTDFLDFDFPDFTGFERWPIFNIADSSIVVAVCILLFYTIFIEGRKKKEL